MYAYIGPDIKIILIKQEGLTHKTLPPKSHLLWKQRKHKEKWGNDKTRTNKKKKNLNFRFKKRKESYKQIFPIILTKLVKKQVSFNFFFSSAATCSRGIECLFACTNIFHVNWLCGSTRKVFKFCSMCVW